MSTFKELALSIYSYKSYKDFLTNKKGKVFSFGMLLVLLYFAITTVAPFVKFVTVDGGITQVINEYVPDFELKDGTLWVEEVIEYGDYNSYIYIDTDPEYYFLGAEEMTEQLYSYGQVILMDSEKIILKDDGIVQEMYYTDLEMEFSRENIMEMVPTIYIFIVVGMIFMYLGQAALFFFGVIFVALLGMIVASCMNRNFTFGQLYLMGIYSRTLPLLIKAVLSLLSIDIFGFVFINFGISVAIIAAAIQKMKEEQQPAFEFVADSNVDNTNTDNYNM